MYRLLPLAAAGLIAGLVVGAALRLAAAACDCAPGERWELRLDAAPPQIDRAPWQRPISLDSWGQLHVAGDPELVFRLVPAPERAP